MISQLKGFIPHRIKMAIKLVFYKGNKYECPFCGYKSRELAPIGYDLPVLFEKQVIGAGKRNAGCFKCESSDRERLVYIYIKDKMRIFDGNKPLKILHFAPEKNLSQSLLDFGFSTYVGGDLFAEGYDYPDFVQNMNVLEIPFNDNTYDLIICNHILEHVLDDRAAMQELFRVLKPNGKAVLQVPISKNSEETIEDFTITDPIQREIIFGQKNHVRIYGQDYTKRLTSVGFHVERFNISQEYPQFGLHKEEDIFIAIKESTLK